MTYVYPAEWTRGKWMGYIREPLLDAASIGGGCYQAMENDGQFLLGHIYRWDEGSKQMLGPFMTRDDLQPQVTVGG